MRGNSKLRCTVDDNRKMHENKWMLIRVTYSKSDIKNETQYILMFRSLDSIEYALRLLDSGEVSYDGDKILCKLDNKLMHEKYDVTIDIFEQLLEDIDIKDSSCIEINNVIYKRNDKFDKVKLKSSLIAKYFGVV